MLIESVSGIQMPWVDYDLGEIKKLAEGFRLRGDDCQAQADQQQILRSLILSASKARLSLAPEE